MQDSPIRNRLRAALRDAMRARDVAAVSALRSALAAIDNASAVPVAGAPAADAAGPHFAGAAAGLGATEVERRSLSEGDAEEIVRAEVTGRRAAAHDHEQGGHAVRADRLRDEADVLMPVLKGEP